MSSIDHIAATPGFDLDGDWPVTMTLEANLADLEMHARDFANRDGFTYSILDGVDVIGCLHIYPSSAHGHDAAISEPDRELPWKPVRDIAVVHLPLWCQTIVASRGTRIESTGSRHTRMMVG